MKDRRSRLLLYAALLLAVGCGGSPARSEATGPMTAAGSDPHHRQLLEQAERFGQVAVLVTLRLPAADAGKPRAIAAARRRLFASLQITAAADGQLAGPGISTVKVFETQPLVALTVTPEALTRLLAQPQVARVEIDSLARPH